MNFDLENFLPYRLHIAAESTSQDFYAHYKDNYGLNRSEWRVMFHIGQNGPISATEISKQSRLEKSKISRAIQKLEQRGWVKRSFNPGNRRGHDLLLTPEGTASFEELRSLAATFNKRLAKQLGTDAMQKLLDQLHLLEDHIDQLEDK